MLATCLGLEAVPITGGLASILCCWRLLAYSSKPQTTARLVFTAFWSAAMVAGHVTTVFWDGFHSLGVAHAVTVSGGLVLLGWAGVAEAVLQGIKLSTALKNEFDLGDGGT